MHAPVCVYCIITCNSKNSTKTNPEIYQYMKKKKKSILNPQTLEYHRPIENKLRQRKEKEKVMGVAATWTDLKSSHC